MATAGHESEAINVEGLKASLQKFKTDKVDVKVDKVSGKGLSTNDYTTDEKNKLAGIAAGAEVNVQSDWNATSGDAFIKNKPTIPDSFQWFGTSSTAANTVQKEVSIPSITSLKTGQIIVVKPTVTSSVAESTLKLNSFDAYPMRYNNAAITTSTGSVVWAAHIPSLFVFDGSYWVFLGHGLDSNTTYSTMSVAEGTTGTKTSARTVRADYLKQIIQALAPQSDWNATSGDAFIKNKPAIPSVAQTTGTSTTAVMSQKAVSDLIPAQASASNQLADKDFVNSSVSTATAEIKGNATSACDTLGEAEALISAEKTRAQGAESTLQTNIDAEATRAQAAESTLNSGKADKATTLAGYGITDAYTKSETYTKTEVNGLVDTPHQEYVTVDAYANLPATGSKDTIYRVSNYNGSTSQVDASVYSEYAWNGSQYIFLCVKSQIGEVLDISVYNNNAKYTDLADALGTDGEHVPQSLRKGGMSIKFVQSSDNKYVQYRLMSDTFNTTVVNWQGVDDVPTAGSDNLVKSEGVYNEIGGEVIPIYESNSFSLNAAQISKILTRVKGKFYAVTSHPGNWGVGILSPSYTWEAKYMINASSAVFSVDNVRDLYVFSNGPAITDANIKVYDVTDNDDLLTILQQTPFDELDGLSVGIKGRLDKLESSTQEIELEINKIEKTLEIDIEPILTHSYTIKPWLYDQLLEVKAGRYYVMGDGNSNYWGIGYQQNYSWVVQVLNSHQKAVIDIPYDTMLYIYNSNETTAISGTIKVYDVTDNEMVESILTASEWDSLDGLKIGIISDVKELKKGSSYYGKRGSALGDSLTESGSYVHLVKDYLILDNYKNCGVGGATLSGVSNTAMVSDSCIETLDINSDFITIAGGTNDFFQWYYETYPNENWHGIGEATFENDDIKTFCGAYNVLLSKIFYKYHKQESGYFQSVDYSNLTQVDTAKNIQIVLVVPTNRYDESATGGKQIADAVRKIANLWGLPYVDLMNDLGINLANYHFYMSDGVHFNSMAYKRYANLLIDKLFSIGKY